RRGAGGMGSSGSARVSDSDGWRNRENGRAVKAGRRSDRPMSLTGTPRRSAAGVCGGRLPAHPTGLKAGGPRAGPARLPASSVGETPQLELTALRRAQESPGPAATLPLVARTRPCRRRCPEALDAADADATGRVAGRRGELPQVRRAPLVVGADRDQQPAD